MSRIAVAVPAGILGILLYIMLVVTLADHVIGLPWVLELLYFTVAGIAWIVPARRLILWAVSADRG